MIISAEFEPDFYETLYRNIKQFGIEQTRKAYLNLGYDPTFLNAALKKIIRTRGW